MTWWEAQEIAAYVIGIEDALDRWEFSHPQMRIERKTINHLAHRIERELPQTNESDKQQFLRQLVDHIEDLRQHLTERLKRDIQSHPSS